MIYRSLAVLFTAVMVVVGGFSTHAQQLDMNQQQTPDIEVSDSELQRFADAMGEIQAIQQQSQQKMQKAIQDEGMKVPRYQEIVKAKRSGGDAEMTDKEQKAFNGAQEKISKEQQKMGQEMQKILKKHDFGEQRFMQISRAMRSDQELQQRFRELRGNPSNQ